MMKNKQFIFSAEKYAAYASFWKKELAEQEEPFILKGDVLEPSEKGDQELSFVLPQSVGALLWKYAADRPMENFVLWLSALSIVLSRYTDRKDLTLLTPLLQKASKEQRWEEMVPLFLDRSEEKSLKGLVLLLAKRLKVFYRYQNYPLDLLEQSPAPNGNSAVLSNVWVFFEGLHESGMEVPLHNGIRIYFPAPAQNKETTVRIAFRQEIFSKAFIVRLGRHLQSVLGQFADLNQNPDDCHLLSAEEEAQLLIDFNQSDRECDTEKTVIDLFVEQARRNPNQVAAIYEQDRLSYRQLDQSSNQLARYLREKGLEQGQLVGICMDRSLAMLRAILSVLKCGAAYVPIDPAYPNERIHYLQEDTGMQWLIGAEEYADILKAGREVNLVLVGREAEAIASTSGKALEDQAQLEHLAYVIYTSGSTGQPKGVMIDHQCLSMRLQGMAQWFGLDQSLRTIQLTNYVFDVSLLELVLPLIVGGSVVIPEKNRIFDLEGIIDYCAEVGVTKIQATPSYLTNWIRAINPERATRLQLEILCSGGESLKKDLAEEIRRKLPQVKLYNHYGPTETTIDALGLDDLEGYVSNNIGRPLPNSKAYIVDSASRPVPIGVPGEILLGGIGVSPGYLNRAELTAERFIDYPFSAGEASRLYKTGDLGRWMADGNIEFLGRKDEQVKIRGFRVELGEIESVLSTSETVIDVAVMAKEDAEGQLRLVAYVVPAVGFDKQQIQQFLGDKLPYYMVPSEWVKMEAMPLTVNGKINKKALPPPALTQVAEKQYIAPRNKEERWLAELWFELLHLERIGIHDNFFELGGHSLLVMTLISKIYRGLAVKVALPEVFENPELALLAALIATKTEHQYQPIPAAQAVAGNDLYPLSDAQKQIWVLEQQQENPTGFILPDYFKLKGNLEVVHFIEAFKNIVRRQESLRTLIRVFQSEPYQKILPYTEETEWISFEDLQQRPDAEQYLAQIAKADLHWSFDLEKGPLYRMRLFRLAPQEHVFLMTIHHIVTDGISTYQIFKELIEGYNKLAGGLAYDLPDLPVQYKDYSAWHLQKASNPKHRAYWLKEFADYTPTVLLSPDFERPESRSVEGALLTLNIEKAQSDALSDFCRRKGISLYMLFASLIQFLMYRYSGQKDITLGSPVSERDHIDLEALVGLFVNILAFRMKIDPERSYGDFLEAVKQKVLNGYKHQSFGFSDLVKDLQISYASDQNPLFSIYLSVGAETLEHLDMEPFAGLEMENYLVEDFKCIHDLVFNFIEKEEGIQGSILYPPKLFRQERIEKIGGHIRQLIEMIVEGEETFLARPLKAIDYLPEEEKKQLMKFGSRPLGFPKDKTVVDLFEARVKAHPEKLALVFEDQRLNYGQANEKANQLARYLQEKGVGKEDFVALCLERSLDMIVVILGILKAGAAYVPIDPKYPEERIQFMLEDSGYVVLIDAESYAVFNNNRDRFSGANLSQKPGPDHMYSMIYTSGSTGKPKGVMLEHQGLINHVCNVKKFYQVDENSRFLQFFNIGFDAAAEEIFTTLSFGASLYIRSEEDLDGTRMIDLINRHQISHADFSSAYFEGLITSLSADAIQHQMTSCGVGGEKINLKFVAKNREKLEVFTKRMFNVYGPTETTLTVSIFPIFEDRQFDQRLSIPIGKPYPNREIYICDPNTGQLLPTGAFGEICIGGVGLSRGYLNRPILNREKFIRNPYSSNADARLYRTGDLGRWLPDGNIEFLGRKDDQVKLRGYRIELGEIETILQGSTWIDQCVVLVRKDAHQPKRLVAYVVPNGKYERNQILQYLKKSLPYYMVPSVLVELPAIPLTGNGKVDKRALPVPDLADQMENVYLAPTNEAEKLVAGIWKELLGAERVGITDNFYELGGDSIKALQVSARLYKAGFKIAVKDILLHQNIAAIVANMRTAIRIADQAPVSGEIPLNAIQKAFFSWKLQEAHHFNQAVLLHCTDGMSPALLERMLAFLQQHHDMLRAYFESDSDTIQQYCAALDHPVPFRQVDLRSEAKPFRALEQVANEVQGSLDLSKQLWAAVYFQLDSSARLLIVLHHLIVDGVSWRILMEDLSTLYFQNQRGDNFDLYLKTDSFKVWSEALQDFAHSEQLLSQKSYWNQIESQELPMIEREMETTDNFSEAEERVTFTLNEEDTSRLLSSNRQTGQAEVNAILLSTFAKALYQTFDLPGQSLLLEGHGREDIFDSVEVSRTIGWFTSFFPFVATFDPQRSWEENIASTQEKLLAIPDKGVGYSILKYLSSPDELLETQEDRSPRISFNYLGQVGGNTDQATAFKIAPESVGETIGSLNERIYDLDVIGLIEDGQLRMGVIFNPHHFYPQTIQKLVNNYRAALVECLDGRLEIVGNAESTTDFTTKNIPQANLQKLNQLFE